MVTVFELFTDDTTRTCRCLASGYFQEFQMWVYPPGVVFGALQIKWHIGQQVNLIDLAQLRRRKHIRVFDGLVVTFGYTDDDYPNFLPSLPGSTAAACDGEVGTEHPGKAACAAALVAGG